MNLITILNFVTSSSEFPLPFGTCFRSQGVDMRWFGQILPFHGQNDRTNSLESSSNLIDGLLYPLPSSPLYSTVSMPGIKVRSIIFSSHHGLWARTARGTAEWICVLPARTDLSGQKYKCTYSDWPQTFSIKTVNASG